EMMAANTRTPGNRQHEAGGMARRSRVAARLAIVAFLAVAICLPASARTKNRPPYPVDEPTSEWRHGPVWYLLTIEEERAYKRLKDKGERRAFIEAFWARRDPTPWTLFNELRKEFWKRVEESNRLFSESVKPGWKTEKGKLYILFGPPKDFQAYEKSVGKRRDFAWRYDARDMPPEVVEVVQTTLNPPINSTDSFGDTVLRPPQSPGFENFLNRLVKEKLRAGDLANLMRLPVTDSQLDEIVTTSEYYNSLPVQSSYDFYRSEGGTTFSTLTLSLPTRVLPLVRPSDSNGESLILYAKMIREQAPSITYSFTNRIETTTGDDIDKVIDDGALVFQAKGDLVPGRYRFYVGLELSQTGQVSFFRDIVSVPSMVSKDLMLSSVTLISRFDKAPEGYDDRKIPFILGPHKVVPRPGHVFRNGQTLGVFYEIYNARPHPKTGSLDLDIEYQFHWLDQDRWVRISSPFALKEVSEPVQRWSFPLSHWPEAEYRLDVTVEDKVSSKVATHEAFFTIEPR
ncbi:MAG: GWxTD domain-containing protein, partial [Acidobacteriota bacterium]